MKNSVVLILLLQLTVSFYICLFNFKVRCNTAEDQKMKQFDRKFLISQPRNFALPKNDTLKALTTQSATQLTV